MPRDRDRKRRYRSAAALLMALLTGVVVTRAMGTGDGGRSAARRTSVLGAAMAAVGRVTVDVMELPVGDGVDFQGQHELELVYVLDGAVTVRRDPYTVRRFEAGDAFEMRRGTTHHAKASGASAKLLVVDLKAERDVSLR